MRHAGDRRLLLSGFGGGVETRKVSSPIPDPEGDQRQERFLSLFLPEQGSVRAFIRSIIWDRSRCEDVFQEVALVLWRELDRYDPQRPFGAWARGVAAKVTLKGLRQARRTPMALSPEAIASLEAAFDHIAFQESSRPMSKQEEALRHCLDRLPDRARLLVHLRYHDALELSDIATRVTSSAEAVRKAISRSREALQRCVERRLRTA
jgi:RNA polymerase sigma-70 factor, ECF subfamily